MENVQSTEETLQKTTNNGCRIPVFPVRLQSVVASLVAKPAANKPLENKRIAAQHQQGFTLIELIIVIIILGIVAVVAAPRFFDVKTDARIAALRGMEGAINTALPLTRKM